MLEILVENYKPLKKIFLYSVIFIAISIYFSYQNLKQNIKDNWNTYRKNPLIIPFAGFLNRPEGKSATEYTYENFMEVVWSYVQKFVDILMIPIYSILDMFTKMLKTYVVVLDKIRSQMSVMRNLLFKMFDDMLRRLQDSAAAVTFYFLKLREQLKRSYGVMQLLISSVEHSFIFLESLVNSPVGKFGQAAEWLGLTVSMFTFGPIGGPIVWRDSLCFHPETIITMKNNDKKAMKDVKIGDVLINDNIVLAKIDSKVTTPMYNLNNVIVSGDHLVKYGNEYVRVKNHDKAKLIDYNHSNIVCFITSSGIIEIENEIFKDYLDTTSNEKYIEIRHKIEEFLNENKAYQSNAHCIDLFTGIDSDLHEDNIIIGSVDILEETLIMYSVNGNKLSGNVLIKNKNTWIRVQDHPDAIYMGENRVRLKQYISNDGLLKLKDGTLIRDFCEINDEGLSSVLDNIIDN